MVCHVSRCVDREAFTMIKTTTVQTADLWAAIDALDGIPDAQSTDWYERIVAAAEAATQAELVQSGLITTQ